MSVIAGRLILQSLSTQTVGNTSNAQTIPRQSASFIARLKVTSSMGTGTLDVSIQHSPGDGVWKELVAFTQATGDTTEDIQISLLARTVWPMVRAVSVFGGASLSCSYETSLGYD